MADYGIKITLPGKDALVSKDPRDHVAWSKFPPLKITKYGLTQLDHPALAFSTDKDFVHGLNYAPMCLAFYELDRNGKWWSEGYLGGNTAEASDIGLDRSVDKYKIRFTSTVLNTGSPPAVSVPIRFLLFDEPAVDSGGSSDKPVGYQTSDIGMLVGKTGKEVIGSKLYDQILNSNCDYLKFHSTTTGSIAFNNTLAGSDTKDFVHGLGYAPAFIVWGNFSTNNQEKPLPVGQVPAPLFSAAYSDTNKIRVVVGWAASGSPSNITFFYRIVVFKNSLFST